jgi:hypothetical protein
MNKESCRVEKWSSRFCYRGTEGCLLSEDGHEINDLKAERDAALTQRDAWGLTHQKDVARIEELERALKEVLLRDQTNRDSLS